MVLILFALLWIPGVAVGIIKKKEEEAPHFPENDLRIERGIKVRYTKDLTTESRIQLIRAERVKAGWAILV